jgi:CheY-like chemotaxis protein
MFPAMSKLAGEQWGPPLPGCEEDGHMKATLLLVEDSKVQRIACERILHKAEYKVLNAADGEQALRVAGENVPDLILLDMMLPKLDGPQVLRALKGNTATADIPVIALTSLSEANEGKLRDEGVAGFFGKTKLFDEPAAAGQFLDLIEQVLKKSRRQMAGA